jgi:hypothetical protein
MPYHSFVVRLYAGSQGRWHGKVTHVGTQETRLFVHLDALANFINQCRDQALVQNAGLDLEAGGHNQSADNPFVLDAGS